jgi:tRNA threonylcarbamoyladenosine biosynthesis protein TsaB
MPDPVTEPVDAASCGPPPILLAIETAGSRCSAAVTRGGTVLAAESRVLRHGHGEALMPMLDRVMAAAELSPHDLDIVAVAIGPGGFTGIRIGLAAATGIALASGARLIGVTGFTAVAHALRHDCRFQASSLLVALDSRREDLYLQLFALETAVPLAPPQALVPNQLRDHVSRFTISAPLLIAGDAADAAAAALAGYRGAEVLRDSAPDAIGVALAAREQAGAAAAAEPVRPLYLRPPDVTLPKPRGVSASPPP